MKTIINDNAVSSDTPTFITNKYVIDTNNAWDYSFGKYDIYKIPQYSLLFLDNKQNSIGGLLTVVEINSPINVFKSTTGGFINLEGVIQLKIDSIDIPKIWLTEDIIKATFFWLQNHIRTYFKEKSVIVWFVTDEYYMCPISHEVKERQYEHFYTFMAECFMKFLKPN